MKKKVFIFDFDGTIVDTATDVVHCFQKTVGNYGFPEPTCKKIKSLIGKNLDTIVCELLPENQRTPEIIDTIKKAYRQMYSAYSKPYTLPFEGILDMLIGLKNRGAKLAINSNKAQSLLDEMVGQYFPANLFEIVIGYQEAIPSKPDPYGVNLILRFLNEEISSAVYIGDSMSDVRTANNANIPCVFVPWGTGSLSEKETKAELIQVPSVLELEACLNEMM